MLVEVTVTPAQLSATSVPGTWCGWIHPTDPCRLSGTQPSSRRETGPGGEGHAAEKASLGRSGSRGMLQGWSAQRTVQGTSSQSPCLGDSAVLGVPAPWRACACTNTCSNHSQPVLLLPPTLSHISPHVPFLSNTSPSKTPFIRAFPYSESDPKLQPRIL